MCDELKEADRRYQRGQRRGGLLEKPVCEDQWAGQVLASKNITLAQLLYFYRKNLGDGRLTETSTCWEVMQNIVLPDTEREQTCYMDTMIGGAKKADCMVTHWWGMTFKELVIAIARHATGCMPRDVLDKKMETAGFGHDDLQKSFWLCMFAANHHRKAGSGHALADIDIIQRVLAEMVSTLIVLDEGLKIMSRAWCVAEISETASMDKPVHFAGHLPDMNIVKELTFPGLDECECFDPNDKTKLVRHYEQQRGPSGTFDQRIGNLLMQGVLKELWGSAVRSKNLEAMADLLGRRVDVNTALSKQRDTALTWACQYNGGIPLLDLLLEARADPNVAATGGWSPLHFACQMGNEDYVIGLLSARADPCASSQSNRTPLLEAAEREHRGILERLLDVGADPMAADIGGVMPVHFACNFNSAEIIQRMGWKSGMRQSKAR